MKLLNKQIKNILYTYKRSKNKSGYNMLYDMHKSFFDAAMFSLNPNILIALPINDDSVDFLQVFFYSLLWVNDPIEFSHNIPYYSEFFTKTIISIHSTPSKLFKKEDLNIIKNRLDTYDILCFDQNPSAWQLDDIVKINYGIPDPKEFLSTPKTKDILIINTKQNKQSQLLYQYLKSTYPNTDMLENIPNDIENIFNIISKYKVCIGLEDYYNLIVCNACGCYCLTSIESYDKNIITVQNYEDMLRLLPELLNKSDYDKVSQSVLSKYDWNEFNTNIQKYINDIIVKDKLL